MNNLYFPFDATSSWAGYDIQGKMAIYFILEEINELLTRLDADHQKSNIATFEDLNTQLNQISVELEYMEDIAIIEEKKYRKIYQVKAGEKTKLEYADCYNLFVAAMMNKMMLDSSTNNDKKFNERGTYLISTNELDTTESIKNMGRNHIEKLISTDYSDLIILSKVSELPKYRTKGSFGSLIRKQEILNFPVKDRKKEVEVKIINPLKELLKSIDDINVKVFPSEKIKDSDTIKFTCIEKIKRIKIMVEKLFPENKELKKMKEKKDEHIYWQLVNKLNNNLFASKKNTKKSEGEKKGTTVNVGEFFQSMSCSINNQIDEIEYVSHVLLDKLHSEMKKIPSYFRDSEIIPCPNEIEDCNLCKNNSGCEFYSKITQIFRLEGKELLMLFKRMMLEEYTSGKSLISLPSNGELQSAIFKNIGIYPKFSFGNGFPEAMIGPKEVNRMIGEMSSRDTPGSIVQQLNLISNTDIKFIEQLFEADYLFHMQNKGAVPSFPFRNDKKFTDITSKDLTEAEKGLLRFLTSDHDYKFIESRTIRVIGKTEAEEKLNGKFD